MFGRYPKKTADGRVSLWVLSMKVTWSDAGAVIFSSSSLGWKPLLLVQSSRQNVEKTFRFVRSVFTCSGCFLLTHLRRSFRRKTMSHVAWTSVLNILVSMHDHYLCYYLLAVCLDVSPLIACFRWSYLTTTEKVRIICAHHIHIPCARDIAGCYMFRNRLVTYMHVLHTIYSMLFRPSYDVEHTRIWCAYGESA